MSPPDPYVISYNKDSRSTAVQVTIIKLYFLYSVYTNQHQMRGGLLSVYGINYLSMRMNGLKRLKEPHSEVLILTCQHSEMLWEPTGLKSEHLHNRTLPQDLLAVQPEMANPQGQILSLLQSELMALIWVGGHKLKWDAACNMIPLQWLKHSQNVDCGL